MDYFLFVGPAVSGKAVFGRSGYQEIPVCGLPSSWYREVGVPRRCLGQSHVQGCFLIPEGTSKYICTSDLLHCTSQRHSRKEGQCVRHYVTLRYCRHVLVMSGTRGSVSWEINADPVSGVITVIINNCNYSKVFVWQFDACPTFRKPDQFR